MTSADEGSKFWNNFLKMVSIVYTRRKELGVERVKQYFKCVDLTKVSTAAPFRKIEADSVSLVIFVWKCVINELIFN